jgi:hypothetical protein
MATAPSTVRVGRAKSRLGDEWDWSRRHAYGRELMPIFAVSSSKAAWFDPVGYGCYYQGAGWSSPVARWAHNPKVAGSNPAPATNNGYDSKRLPFSENGSFFV